MEYSIDDQKRHWHEIADALLREANTRKMAVLLTELNQASGDLQEAKIVFGRTRDRDSARAGVPTKRQEILLTPTGLLMEGVYTP